MQRANFKALMSSGRGILSQSRDKITIFPPGVNKNQLFIDRATVNLISANPVYEFNEVEVAKEVLKSAVTYYYANLLLIKNRVYQLLSEGKTIIEIQQDGALKFHLENLRKSVFVEIGWFGFTTYGFISMEKIIEAIKKDKK